MLDGIEQGGITYLKTDLDDVFNMSDAIITLLQELFTDFAWYGVAKYPSENVALFVQHINDVSDGPVGSNHGSLQKPLLLALGHRAIRDLPRCTVRG